MKYQKAGKYKSSKSHVNLFGLFKTALIIWTNLRNYLENAKNVEVKWFNCVWKGLSGRIWNVEDDCTA